MKTKQLFLLVIFFVTSCAPQFTPAPFTKTPAPSATVLPSSTPEPTPTITPKPEDTVKKVLDIVYCSPKGVDLKMDMFIAAENQNLQSPVVIYIHGGAWAHGDNSAISGKDVYALTQAGFVVFSLDYRLAPEYRFPAMIEDVKCAVRSIRAHAQEYKVDPNHIGVYGASAGGHLAALLGTSDDDKFITNEYAEYSSRVQAVADYFGPVDLANYRKVNRVFPPKLLSSASPINHVTNDDPPFLIVHGDKDDVVAITQSQAFYEKLLAEKVSASFVIVKNAGHGFKPTPEGAALDPTAKKITRMLVEFFKKYLME